MAAALAADHSAEVDHFAEADRRAVADRSAAEDRREAAAKAADHYAAEDRYGEEDRFAVVARFAQEGRCAEADRYAAADRCAVVARMLAAQLSVGDLKPQARLVVTPDQAVATIPRFVRALLVAAQCPPWQALWALHPEHPQEHDILWMERGSAVC